MADAYSKIGWENSPSEKTPINMTNLNHMDEGIEKNRELISQLEEQKIDHPSTGAVGQILEIATVDENGKPKTYKAVDKPIGGEITDEQYNEQLNYAINQLKAWQSN